jgi:hypothetical protein
VAGTNGIVVSAGATDVVILRNLRFDGLLGNGSNSANAGVNGIRFLSDRQLTIQNVNVFGFAQNCIDIEPSTSMKAVISNSSVDNCGAAGILVKPGSGANVGVSIDRAMVFNTVNGILANGTGGGTTSVQVFDSNISGNATSGVSATTNTQTTNLFVHNSVISNNNPTGVVSSGAQASVLLSQTVITNNSGAAFSTASVGTIFTFHNDMPFANTGG